ncbi:MAG: glutathione peroxidase [Nitrospinae bacterium]|nr:glutathione peroxidase [Nitrospinota bacterium]
MKSPLYNINVKTIFGEEQALSRFEGKVLLIVNVASECGFTRQYSSLQKLYEKYKDKGLRILAFPCNDFGRQEPGEDKEIKSFCIKNYGVSFNLFSKVRVLGPKQTPLYKYLQETNLTPVGHTGFKTFLMRCVTGILLKIKGDVVPQAREVKWNFHKFLIDKQGYPVARFSSEIEPDSPLLVQRVEEELNK